MSVLIDFFAVRPVFTLYGLRVLWGALLIDQALPLLAVLGNPNLSTASIVPLLTIFLHTCLNVVLFRLLIEVAAAVLLGGLRHSIKIGSRFHKSNEPNNKNPGALPGALVGSEADRSDGCGCSVPLPA